MKILISGGFGFLGTNLAEMILDRYHDNVHIHVVDNLSTNPIPYEVFLSEIGFPKNLTYDITEIHEYCQKTEIHDWDAIFHLASPVGPAGVLGYAGNISYMITRDARTLAEYAIKCDAKLVDISTSEIYGGGRDGLCKEEYPRIITSDYSARLEYAVGKLASEVALVNMTRVTKLRASIIRPFNIAGPRQSGKGGFVLPRFIGRAIVGQPLTVFGDGSQVRAFTHVKDMCAGIILAAERGKNGAAYNLGNIKNKISILEMAEKVINIVNKNVDISFVDPKTIYGELYEEANDKYPDATYAETDLGWKPKYDANDVISDAAEYMKRLDKPLFEDLAGLNK